MRSISLLQDHLSIAAAFALLAATLPATLASPARAPGGDVTISADTSWCADLSESNALHFGDLIIDEGATLTVPAGTMIRCTGHFTNHGVIRADGRALELLAARIENHGEIHGNAVILRASGRDADALVIDNRGTIRSSGTKDDSGRITLHGGRRGNVRHSGTLLAMRTISGESVGGDIEVTGGEVILAATAVIDASGDLSGGTVKVGGGIHGKDTSIDNATNTGIERGAVVRADAKVEGDGGTVTIWADETTIFHGEISTRGAGSGSGGFVEVSGKRHLGFDGVVDVDGDERRGGTDGSVLLDPGNLLIEAGPATPLPDPNGIDFATPDTVTDVIIRASALEALTGNVEVQAHLSMLINAPLDFSNQTAGERVVFRAGANLHVGASITTAGGRLQFIASDPGGIDDPGANLTIGADIGDGGTGPIEFINDGGGVIELDADVTSVGAVNFEGAVFLASDATVSAGGDITFSDFVMGGSRLVANTFATTAFARPVEINALVTNAGGTTTIDGGLMMTSGAQTFNDDVVLGDDTVFASTSDGDIAFGGTLAGFHAVEVSTAGTTTFGDTVNLDSLATDTGGSTRILANVSTTGFQIYQDEVITTDGIGLSADSFVRFDDRLEIAGPGTIGMLDVAGDMQLGPDAILGIDILGNSSDRLVVVGGTLELDDAVGNRPSLDARIVAANAPPMGASFDVISGTTAGTFDEGEIVMLGGDNDFSIGYSPVRLTMLPPHLRILSAVRNPDTGSLTVTWSSRPGRTYRVQESFNLTAFRDFNPPGILPSEGLTTDGTISFTQGIPSSYYVRVSEELP